MEPITRTLASTDDNTALPIQPNVFQEKSVALLRTTAAAWDQHIVGALHRWSIPALRLALGLVFVWFGALKVFGVSPVDPATFAAAAVALTIVALGAHWVPIRRALRIDPASALRAE